MEGEERSYKIFCDQSPQRYGTGPGSNSRHPGSAIELATDCVLGHFTSRDMGYYPFYFHVYGILWSIFLFTFRDIGYLGEVTMWIWDTCWIWNIGYPLYTHWSM